MSRLRQIEEVAAHWLIRREEADWSEAEQASFDSWLDQSMAHKAAFWRLEHGWREADRIRGLGSGAIAGSKRSVIAWRRYAIAASLAAVLFVSPLMLREMRPSSASLAVVHAQTAIGGHDQLSLPDGSTVELNTATIIRASVSKKQRDVWLEKGEAFFSVQRSDIPFIVHAGPRVVMVIGTKFSVWRDGDTVRVAVLEGKVSVSEAGTKELVSTATITKGDLLETQGSSTLLLQNADARVERSLSWREGMLQFDRTPLALAAQEFNRYNEKKLVVTGEASLIPIGGSFRASNSQAFARLLRDAYGLRVEETPTETRISG